MVGQNTASFNKQFRVALYAIDGIGPALHSQILHQLQKHEITPKEFWVGGPSLYRKIRINEKIANKVKNFNKEHNHYSYFQYLQQKNIWVVTPEENEYPALLKQIENHPPALFVRGKDVSGFGQNPLAIVGTRKITPYGQRVISQLVPDLVRSGFQIISGFMYGVDVSAQKKSLENNGQTTGVLGFGFDHMYPKHHGKILDEFLAKGASFITPFAPHTRPSKGTFVARNSIVAGMSLGTLVIEAAARSGSFITARLAGEYGRSVMVVSGSIFNKYAEGTKKLANQGAKLVTGVNDVIEEVGGGDVVENISSELAEKSREDPQFLGTKKEIMTHLSMGNMSSDNLSEKLKKSISEVNIHLSELELDGMVAQSGAGWEVC